eukprot:4703923-Lingulodinium_polyedra.AAC.1
MQRQLIVLSAEAIITGFFAVIGEIRLQLVGGDGGGRRNRNVGLTTRTAAGAVVLLVDSTK